MLTKTRIISLVSCLFMLSCAEGNTSNNSNNINNSNNSNNINNTNNTNINNTNNTNNTNCTNECNIGTSYCEGAVVTTCQTGISGCLEWIAGTDCAESSMVCILNGGNAECSVNCQDQCTEGATVCQDSVLRVCETQASGCLDFSDSEDCADSLRICGDVGGVAACMCNDSCTEGICNGTSSSDCVADSWGCYHLDTAIDCALTNQICQVNGLNADCVCDDQCTSGTSQCSGTVIQTCTADGNGCLDWSSGTDCASTSQICTLNGSTAECTTPTGPVTLLSENFDGTWVPTGWSVYDGADIGTWVKCTSTSCEGYDLFTLKSNGVAYVNSDDFADFEEGLSSPTFNCTGYSTVTLEFDHYFKYYQDALGRIDISTNGGSTWTTGIRQWSSNTYNVHETIDISSYAANQANVKIRFYYIAYFDWYWIVDNVTVTAQ
ncbi:hypothetical protein KKF34_20085 [Myxococcota bacterium]|nr:hypothetical protein [Myxococcota bacterium]MBU1380833.1 hypothetical protein [Myxococcota bacterium]MBU1499189.1 hypothetical protein [Myxococcota bacterium]